MHSWTNFSRCAVFISGGGSTLQALLDMKEFMNVCLVVTNRKNVLGTLKALRAGVPVYFFSKNESYADLNHRLRDSGIQKIILTGFMRIIPEDFVLSWAGRIFNIHPSLLPAYKGLKAMERSYQDQVDMGVTIHHVSPGVDEGAIWLQKKMVQSDQIKTMSFDDANLWMRAGEQFLLRELAMKGLGRV